ncbi:RlpA-like double-psi beta-barrel-protein domain-containing protein-containing protein [Podospora aff. communis PSN243]|uniref:cellulase n=1 Tax=Podospora aff. communis PSN243 TaxID=3040156 RepID=A0AAV9G9U8_9PEZI|nr:RlpA-like double-psi beta-barrel-protein domain-containing protein-containing protein [Podospora aff. communis PSN243]
MRAIFCLLAFLASYALAQNRITNAKSYTGWDCCKPVCASNNNRNDILTNRGVAKVCDRSNQLLDQATGIRTNSGCMAAGASSAYMCDTYQPMPQTEDFSYAFAIQVSSNQNADNAACCKCYNVWWTTGAAAAANKSMIVQIVTPGGASGNIRQGDLIILTPGGGVGPLSAGCTNQYGTGFSWGETLGGVKNREACDKLPANLQGGCYWRFNWARGEMNGWDIQYEPITCPSRLTEISGCRANP